MHTRSTRERKQNVEALESVTSAAEATLKAAMDKCRVAEERLKVLAIAVPPDGSHDTLCAELRAHIRGFRERVGPFQAAFQIALKPYEAAKEGLNRDRRAL